MHEVSLTVDDFDRYFAELWQLPPDLGPFPWQTELVHQLDAERRWPDLVDLPTGTGKTSLLDIGVFLLALDAARPPAERWMPRRIVLVVDRRVVVDQADERGARIADVLTDSSDGVLGAVASRLRRLSGDGPPLVTTVLRGGIVRDETWARRPDVPALVSSTVDQVGSRLLFRGYGISTGMRPIHAGLLGNDALFLLDEVHLARPWAETLTAISRCRARHDVDDDHRLPDRWQVVQLTATPATSAERRFPTAPLDPSSHPVLERRMLAPKPARLEVVKVTNDAKEPTKANEQFAAGCVKLVRGLLTNDHIRTAGVIVNRVDTARRVARQLVDLHDPPKVVLLTGRMRPLDRDQILDQWGNRLMIGRPRHDDDKPLVVVATQSIEAGADFDLDGIVTECASLDALRQRFGRVDRDGRLGEAMTPSSSIVAIRSTDLGGEPDAVYGTALANTWKWLRDLDVVDFGLCALAPPPAGAGPQGTLVPAPARPPRLLPSHLDRWVQTSQRASSWDPEVAAWLQGTDHAARVPDVQLVWRADLDESVLDRNVPAPALAEVQDRLLACPPASSEALAISIGDFRRWAGGLSIDPETADVTLSQYDAEVDRDIRPIGRFFRWFSGRVEPIEAVEVCPGDTVIVPANAGGLWESNWDPKSKERVEDVALLAAARQRRRAIVRLSDVLWPTETVLPDPADLEHESASARLKVIRDLLRQLADEGVDRDTGAVLRHLTEDPTLQARSLVERVNGDQVVRSYIVTSRRLIAQDREGVAGDLAPEDGRDSTSFSGARRISLFQHLDGVSDWAERLANNLGLPDALVADLSLAGRMHDLGKADSRFQRLLRTGEDVGDTEILAKSATPEVDAVARRRARERSGYPARARHELLSLAMTADVIGLGAGDIDLVQHLVASHHGFGRYRFDPSIDSEPKTVAYDLGGQRFAAPSDHGLQELGAGQPDRFWRLVRRYGWFGVTWLEAILRLADHCESRAEQETPA